jgi:hypothetical protein
VTPATINMPGHFRRPDPRDTRPRGYRQGHYHFTAGCRSMMSGSKGAKVRQSSLILRIFLT